MKVRKINDNQRITSIHYRDIFTLLDREEYMLKTMVKYLNRINSKEFITETFITNTENNYILNIVLETID